MSVISFSRLMFRPSKKSWIIIIIINFSLCFISYHFLIHHFLKYIIKLLYESTKSSRWAASSWLACFCWHVTPPPFHHHISIPQASTPLFFLFFFLVIRFFITLIYYVNHESCHMLIHIFCDSSWLLLSWRDSKYITSIIYVA